jgi:hypothetical protein
MSEHGRLVTLLCQSSRDFELPGDSRVDDISAGESRPNKWQGRRDILSMKLETDAMTWWIGLGL